MKSLIAFSLVAIQAVSARYGMYIDQLTNRNLTAGIDHVIMAFAESILFTNPTPANYTPFASVESMRARFDPGTKFSLAIGGWGDNAGFDLAVTNDTTRRRFAKNVAQTLDRLGFDGVDIDWEYPGGNGADYRQVPNSKKTGEINQFPKLLHEIRSAIGKKVLSVAVPGLRRDMIAYTPEEAPKIWEVVDFVNVMAYDLMNRRDNITKHHTDVQGSLEAVDAYLELGLKPSKVNLGFAFYAKYFKTAPGYNCTATPLGCPTAELEAPDGSDTGNSGALTFEASNYLSVPTDLSVTTDGSCGATVGKKCPEGYCCSLYGYCGATADYCGASCLAGYGKCDDVSVTTSWENALRNGKVDAKAGGQYYWDPAATLFWTWDTPALINRKFQDIIAARGLGGAFAWSLGEDSHDWSHLQALQAGVKAFLSPVSPRSASTSHQRRKAHYHKARTSI
ncbi:hypothetical protein AOCH_006590 [Aspergillus ochraceoroseus]|uniref:chitinase n=1 Tax=Aspergillus ochraceoroseus TaxID=138278 RepID=A0A0F8TYA0_9EURO|nr:hypothetical protein AOCH_006590 [Aspergillus ochraceoroseus]